jgi:ubiquinone/menaquinone biosynthesis C-methylase UbiE
MIYFSEQERIDKEKRINSYPDFVKKWYYSTVTVQECYNKLLAPLIGSETVLLDAGCGKKGIMDLYVHENELSVGTDISLQAMKENRSMDCYTVSNLEYIPFKSGTFDVIVSAWVVEHMKEPPKIFKEFHRVLKRGGSLIIVTNSLFHPMMFLSFILPERLRDAIKKRLFPPKFDEDTFPTYYKLNSVRKMKVTLKDLGFSKVFTDYSGDPSIYLFFRRIFPIALLYEKVTNIKWLKFLKMHVVGHYIKR